MNDSIRHAHQHFLNAWNTHFPETPPINYLFKHRLAQRWARIHSLPAAKRYAETDDEWEILLNRQNQIIDHLVTNGTTIKVVINYAPDDVIAKLRSTFELQDIGTFFDRDDETEFPSFTCKTQWTSHRLNQLLRFIANDEVRAFIVAPCNESTSYLIAPYDGGVDVILSNPTQCATFKHAFAEWLSLREDGL
jgi:hypothetical protein